MKLSPTRLRTYGFFLATIVALLDQWSKAFVIASTSKMVFPVTVLSYFNIVLVFNKGVSFGMLSGAAEWMPLALTVFLSFIVLLLIMWLVRANETSVVVVLGFVIGGAIGNLIDRVRVGSVTDFLDFHVGNYHWPAFNIADSAI